MMTVHEVSRLTGVSIRALQYYDRIGLLPPAEKTAAGYRLYDGSALERLQQILLFRELEFPLKDIRRILASPDFDRDKALAQQIGLLRMKRDRLDRLIALACALRETGGENDMGFSAFDTGEIDAYAERAKAAWGATPEYREYEERAADRPPERTAALSDQLMGIFAEIGALKDRDPADAQVQALIRRLRDFITANFYTCSDRVLAGLGELYAAGGEMKENIDRHGGEGTAAFASAAIRVFCGA